MICVVYRWRWAVLVHLVALILLSVKGEIVLGLELGSLIVGDQELPRLACTSNFLRVGGPYSMVEQWLQTLLDTPPRMNIASHEP